MKTRRSSAPFRPSSTGWLSSPSPRGWRSPCSRCSIPSPLEEAASPLLTPNPAKAPWYFLWLQEIVADTTVRLGPLTINGALVGGVLLPLCFWWLTALWPWLDRSPAATAGVWMPRERRTQILVFAALVVLVTGLTIVGLLRGPSWHFFWPWQPWPELPSRF